MAKRAKETHPTYQKLVKVFKVFDAMDLSFEFGDYGVITVSDTNRPGEHWELVDLDDGRGVDVMPPTLEWKLVRRQ